MGQKGLLFLFSVLSGTPHALERPPFGERPTEISRTAEFDPLSVPSARTYFRVYLKMRSPARGVYNFDSMPIFCRYLVARDYGAMMKGNHEKSYDSD